MHPSLLFVHALSPLHPGTGHSSGIVDLPIARDRATGFPLIPGSTIKGVLRAKAADLKAQSLERVFGPPQDRAHEHAGALLVGDANLLLLPVRSVHGTFAYVTSPLLLQRFARDAREAGLKASSPSGPSLAGASVPTKSPLVQAGKVLFEDLDFTGDANDQVASLGENLAALVFPDASDGAARAFMAQRVAVVHDDAMSFLAQHALDVRTRIALDHDTKTVRQGALWTEENLPTETVLVSLIQPAPPSSTTLTREQILATVDACIEHPLQLGGNATVGRGRCRLIRPGGAA